MEKLYKLSVIAAGIIISICLMGCGDNGDPAPLSSNNNGNGNDIIVVSFVVVTLDHLKAQQQGIYELCLTFDKKIEGLSVADVSLSGIDGVIKGNFRYEYIPDYHYYYLEVSGFTSGGTLKVSVAKSGYLIRESTDYQSEKAVPIYIY
jgi:hypothetical protein